MVAGTPIPCRMLLAASEDRKSTGSMEPMSPTFLKKCTLSRRHRLWNVFHKPILALLVGGLIFGAGTAASLLYFTRLGRVPYLVGPVLLSVGLMFLVTGLVWLPVIKQRLQHKAMTQMSYSKFTSDASARGSLQPCASISQSIDLLA